MQQRPVNTINHWQGFIEHLSQGFKYLSAGQVNALEEQCKQKLDDDSQMDPMVKLYNNMN